MLTRRSLLCAVSAITLALTVPAQSWTHGFNGPTGKSILNGFNSVASGDYPYKNFLLGAPTLSNQSGTAAFPGTLDNNGYPITTPVGANLAAGQVPIDPTWAGNWILGWPTGKASNTIDNGGPTPRFAIVSDTGPTAPNVQGAVTFGISVKGTSGRVVFNFNGNPPPTSLPFYFNTTPFIDGTLGGMYLCRDNGTDEAAILSGDLSRMFNDDFITKVRALNPYVIRGVDIYNTNNNNTMRPWTDRFPTTAFSFGASISVGTGGNRWLPRGWVGAISGTDIYACGSYADMPVVWTHGETFQGQFGASGASTIFTFSAVADNGSGAVRLTTPTTAALTTGQKIAFGNGYNNGLVRGNYTITVIDATHIDLATNIKTGLTSVYGGGTGTGQFSTATIDCGSRGAKLLVSAPFGGGILGTGVAVTNNANGTFSYDADFDAVLYTSGANSGIVCGPPIEVLVALANKLSCGLWYCFPQYTINTEIAPIVSYIRTNLNSLCPAYFEYTNEVWNVGFGQTGTALIKGQNLNLSPSGNVALFSYYGLKTKQIMDLVVSAWGGREARLHTVMATQAFAGNGVAQNPNIYRLGGAGLTPSGNAVYAASSISGGVNYTVAPNRPIDVCTDLSYATYYSGAQCANVDANYTSLSGISGASNLLGHASNYVNGNPTQQAAALAFLDNDIRQGTLNGVAGSQTLLALDSGYTGGGVAPFGIYPGWETICTSYDASRISNGIPLLKVSCYEGGCEIRPVSSSRLVALGDGGNSVTDAANVAALVAGYKNTGLFKQLVKDQFSQFMGTFATSPNFGLLPHSFKTAWYTFGSGSQWALLSGDLNSIPFQSYYGMQEYNR